MLAIGIGPLARQELAARLEHERDWLLRRQRSHAEAVRALGAESESANGQADPIGVAAEQAAQLALEYAERDQLAEVAAALLRLDDDLYGHCERCSAPLDWTYLYELPWARHCPCCAALDTAEGALPAIALAAV